MDTTRSFIGGVPYGPDIKRLEERFPVSSLEIGHTIPKDEFASTIYESWGTARCRGVYAAFGKRLLEDHGILLKPQGEAIVVLDDNDRVDEMRANLRGIGRKSIKVRRIGATINRKKLDDERNATMINAEQCMSSIQAALRIKAKVTAPGIEDFTGATA